MKHILNKRIARVCALLLFLSLAVACISPIKTSTAASKWADLYVLTSKEQIYTTEGTTTTNTYLYDYNKQGLLSKMSYGENPVYGELYFYNKKNRLVKIQPFPENPWGSAYEIKYKKGLKSRLDVYSMSSGKYDNPKPVFSVKYKYDSKNRVIKVGARGIKYDSNGYLSGFSYDSKKWMDITCDARGNISSTSYDDGTFSETFTNTYDNGLLVKQDIDIGDNSNATTINLKYEKISVRRDCLPLIREQQWTLINDDYLGTFTAYYFLPG